MTSLQPVEPIKMQFKAQFIQTFFTVYKKHFVYCNINNNSVVCCV